MSHRRVHVVDDEGQVNLPIVPVTLCGRKMLSWATYMMFAGHRDNSIDDMMELRRGAVLYCATEHRPFVTVHEFIYDGDDSPDCITCRRKLQVILDAMESA